ncbi:MAG: CoA-disulfide reductase [Erysipelotrichaceae bacterium]
MKVIVIGGTAAGMSAAAKMVRSTKDLDLVVYEKRDYISFGACGLPYFIGDEFSNQTQMLARSKADMEAMGIKIQDCYEVVSLDTVNKKIIAMHTITKEKIEDSYERLLIATGAEAIVPPIANIKGENVFPLRSMEDGLAIKEMVAKPEIKRVAVIGAGFIGLELVEAMVHLGKQVDLFQLESRVLPDVFDQPVTDVLEASLREHQVGLHLDTMVTALHGNPVHTVETANQTTYPCDMVIYATGVRPATGFLNDQAILRAKNGAILVDAYGQTNVADVYAAGDCAMTPHRLVEDSYIPLATVANKFGRMVGENMVTTKKAFPGMLGSSCLRVFELQAAATGLTLQKAKQLGLDVKSVWVKDKNHTSYVPGQVDIYVQLVYDAQSKRILGGQIVGKADVVQRINVLATAIYAKLTTEELGMMDFAYAPPFARTWDVLNVAGNVAK